MNRDALTVAEMVEEEEIWAGQEEPPMPDAIDAPPMPAVPLRRGGCGVCRDPMHVSKDCTSDKVLTTVCGALKWLSKERDGQEPPGSLLSYLTRKKCVCRLLSLTLNLRNSAIDVSAALLDRAFVFSIAASIAQNPDIGLVASAVFLTLCGQAPPRTQAGVHLAMAAAHLVVADRTPRDVLRRLVSQQEEEARAANTRAHKILTKKNAIQIAKDVIPPQECPICMEQNSVLVKTACGHCFCADCLGRTLKASKDRAKVKCPSCRQNMFPIAAGEGLAFLIANC